MKTKIIICLFCIFCLETRSMLNESTSIIEVDLKHDVEKNYIHLYITNNGDFCVSINSSPLNGSSIYVDLLDSDNTEKIFHIGEFGLGTPHQQKRIQLAPKDTYQYTYRIEELIPDTFKTHFDQLRFTYSIKSYIIDKDSFKKENLKGEKNFFRWRK